MYVPLNCYMLNFISGRYRDSVLSRVAKGGETIRESDFLCLTGVVYLVCFVKL